MATDREVRAVIKFLKSKLGTALAAFVRQSPPCMPVDNGIVKNGFNASVSAPTAIPGADFVDLRSPPEPEPEKNHQLGFHARRFFFSSSQLHAAGPKQVRQRPAPPSRPP